MGCEGDREGTLSVSDGVVDSGAEGGKVGVAGLMLLGCVGQATSEGWCCLWCRLQSIGRCWLPCAGGTLGAA